ncbi:glycosyltransferase [Niallia sp. 03190]|uniref:glycosyltransferase n=1 Tax=Niallia sp. 03190 TaxID=3458061 RepID=UPI004044B88C
MGKIAVVILNYLNYEDTIDCVMSLLKQNYKEYQIIIVDNGSNNKSFEKLVSYFSEESKVTIIKSDKNIGFARGNNIGISYARKKLNINKILLVNNDTIFTDNDYLKKLNSIDYLKSNVGAIGTKIIGSDGLNQNPIYKKITKKQIYSDYIYIVLSRLKSLYILRLILWLRIKMRNKNIEKEGHTNTNKRSFFLHGSSIYLTPLYIDKFYGLYPKTFLYYEEDILGVIFKKSNLNFLYYDLAEIYHKEDRSSKLSFNNKDKIKYKYLLQSIKETKKLYKYDISKIRAIIHRDINKE